MILNEDSFGNLRIMDNKVDDFLSEINEISAQRSTSKFNAVWRKCQDELTGYSYFWNTKTDEVTQKQPSDLDYKQHDMHLCSNIIKKDDSLPKVEKTHSFPQKEVQKSTAVKKQKQEDDSDDEKIVLISSYEEHSDSENEEIQDDPDDLFEHHLKDTEQNQTSKSVDYHLNKKDIVTNVQDFSEQIRSVDIKKITGISLVAGYSDSDDDEKYKSKETPKSDSDLPPHISQHIFPIVVSTSDEICNKNSEYKDELEINLEFEHRPQQRKKRIGVPFIDTKLGQDFRHKKRILEEEINSIGSTPKIDGSTLSKSLMNEIKFVKSDILNPYESKPLINSEFSEEYTEQTSDFEKLNIMYLNLIEKLEFLSSSYPVVQPTQTMIIQAQTLFEAHKQGGLIFSYLKKWLNDTCSELIKLENDTAPNGWLLLWDKSHKRYFYQNKTTGITRWEYPQTDTQDYDDAMEISTTPPPDQEITASPPVPPTIRSPTPPPPPIISTINISKDKTDSSINPYSPLLVQTIIQPLPPGVELSDLSLSKCVEQDSKRDPKQDPLHSALDSFYSDIAAIGTASENSQQDKPITNDGLIATNDGTKKKRKKVKLTPGLSLKKKGVSQLVEKWKNVQQHINY